MPDTFDKLDTLIDHLDLNTRGIVSLIGAGGKTSLMFCLARDLANAGRTVLTTTTTKILMPGPKDSPHTIIAGAIEDLIKASKSFLKTYPHFSAARIRDRRSGKLKGFGPGLINQLWEAHMFDWIILEADGAKRKPLKASNPHEPVIPDRTSHLILVTGLDAVGKPLDEDHVHRAGLFSENTGMGLGSVLDEQAIARGITVEMKKATGFCLGAKSYVFLNKADTGERIRSGQKIARLLQTDPAIGKILIGSLTQGPGIVDSVAGGQVPKRGTGQKESGADK